MLKNLLTSFPFLFILLAVGALMGYFLPWWVVLVIVLYDGIMLIPKGSLGASLNVMYSIFVLIGFAVGFLLKFW